MSIFQTNGHHSMHLFRWLMIGGGLILALALATTVVSDLTPAPAPAPVVVPHPAATGTPHPVARPAAPVVPTGPILLPGQQPGGVMRGAHAQVAIASAQVAAGPWTDLGDVVIHAPTASFSTVAPTALRAVAPSSGWVRVRWSGWMKAQAGGVYTLAMSVSGGPTQSVVMTVDGIAQPVASAVRNCGWMGMCQLPTSTAAGSVALAAGWHLVQVTVIAPAAAGAGSQPADVTIYARAPDSGTPAVIVPRWPAGAAP